MLGIHLGMYFPVHGHDRRQSAGAEARDRFERKEAVVRCLFLPVQPEVFIDRIIDRPGLAHMTRRTRADLDDMLSLGLQRKILVECRHTVYL